MRRIESDRFAGGLARGRKVATVALALPSDVGAGSAPPEPLLLPWGYASQPQLMTRGTTLDTCFQDLLHKVSNFKNTLHSFKRAFRDQADNFVLASQLPVSLLRLAPQRTASIPVTS